MNLLDDDVEFIIYLALIDKELRCPNHIYLLDPIYDVIDEEKFKNQYVGILQSNMMS